MITDWIGALTTAAPKVFGMGGFALIVAWFTHRSNVKIAEKERERLFRGNREEGVPWTR